MSLRHEWLSERFQGEKLHDFQLPFDTFSLTVETSTSRQLKGVPQECCIRNGLNGNFVLLGSGHSLMEPWKHVHGSIEI